MKTRLLALLATLLCSHAFAVYEVGDTVADMCWTDVNSKNVCLNDFSHKVRVLIYNAGWCGPCNQEFDNLSPRVSEFAGKPVEFISLSAFGWTHGSQPDVGFLQQWKTQHNITFTVAASPGDGGNLFGQQYIPNVQVIDANGKLTYKDVAPDVDTLFTNINAALGARR